MSDDLADPEASYRRGYTHGAWDVIKAVGDKLSPVDRAELERWFADDAREWRLKHMRDGDGRDARGRYSTVPPRQRLRIFSVR